MWRYFTGNSCSATSRLSWNIHTAAKKFGIPEFEGLVIGATLVYPNMLGTGGLANGVKEITAALPGSNTGLGRGIRIKKSSL